MKNRSYLILLLFLPFIVNSCKKGQPLYVASSYTSVRVDFQNVYGLNAQNPIEIRVDDKKMGKNITSIGNPQILKLTTGKKKLAIIDSKTKDVLLDTTLELKLLKIDTVSLFRPSPKGKVIAFGAEESKTVAKEDYMKIRFANFTSSRVGLQLFSEYDGKVSKIHELKEVSVNSFPAFSEVKFPTFTDRTGKTYPNYSCRLMLINPATKKEIKSVDFRLYKLGSNNLPVQRVYTGYFIEEFGSITLKMFYAN